MATTKRKMFKKLEMPAGSELAAKLAEKLIGQPDAIEAIVPFIEAHNAGLGPEERPIGTVLLLGPTGTGKTRTVEALAEVLHGSKKNLLKIDCGEFQSEHEVAKLIGAPPGYLGHRETPALLTQAKVNAVASDQCDISLVLFDEIEKASGSVTRLLLGVLDKAVLRLGDNTRVDFQHCLIFLTTNLGAGQMQKANRPDFGFEALLPAAAAATHEKLASIGTGAVKRKFSPEFVNRIDAVITYRALDRAACELILEQLLEAQRQLIARRLGLRAFEIAVTPAGADRLLERGVSVEYGARELKRTLHRHFFQPLASLVAHEQIAPGAHVTLDVDGDEFQLLARAA